MITGATLINYTERYSTKQYFYKRFVKTVIPFFIWSLLSLVYLLFNNRIEITSLKKFIELLLNTQFNSFYWFFIPLFSVYMSIPVLSAIPKIRRKQIFGYGIVITILFNSLLPFLFSLSHINYNEQLKIPSFMGYLIYILLGYWFHEFKLSKRNRTLIYILGFLGLCAHIIGTWYFSYLNGNISTLFKGYTNIPSLCYSVSIFVFFRYMNEDIQRLISKITIFFSDVTFGIYLIHWFVIQYISTISSIQRTSIEYRTLGTLIVFLISTFIVKILHKNKYIRKVIP